ncbi:hypothetical protein ACS0TY_025399 [Phlomoides rotata]
MAQGDGGRAQGGERARQVHGQGTASSLIGSGKCSSFHRISYSPAEAAACCRAEAILCMLVAIRDQMLKRLDSRENINKLVVYGSDQTHSALQKATHIAGINPKNSRAVATIRANAFRLTTEALRASIESDVKSGLVPLFLCPTIDTTSSTAINGTTVSLG